MRKVKSFKLFESSESDEILSTCKDMLGELDLISSDFKWNCEWKVNRFDPEKQKKLHIEIWKEITKSQELDSRVFLYSDISHIMDTIKDYMKECGYIISSEKEPSTFKSFKWSGARCYYLCLYEIKFNLKKWFQDLE